MKYQFIGYLLALCSCTASLTAAFSAITHPAIAQVADEPIGDEPIGDAPITDEPIGEPIDESAGESFPPTLNLPDEVLEQSPVLQRWLESVPNVSHDIRHDPSFKTRFQAGYSFFPSSDSTSGFVVGVEDVFLGDTPLTLSADYQQNFRGDRTAYGADLHYYLLPLGGYFNVSPILGYRHASAGDDYQIDGAHLGLRARFVPSRTGAADITLDQSWVVGDSQGLSVTQINVGYAVTQHLRLSTDFEWQSTADDGDSRVGLNFEWAF